MAINEQEIQEIVRSVLKGMGTTAAAPQPRRLRRRSFWVSLRPQMKPSRQQRRTEGNSADAPGIP